MLDKKPNSAFFCLLRISSRLVANSARTSAEILLWLLMLARHFPTQTRKYLGTIQDSRYEDQVGQFCGNDIISLKVHNATF